MAYAVYIVACADGTLYTGIATDVARRICEHNGGSLSGAELSALSTVRGKGARYTATRRPVVLVFEARFETRSAAAKEEARIKRLTRAEKQQLIEATTVAMTAKSV